MIKCTLCKNVAIRSVVGIVDYPNEGTDGYACINLCEEHSKKLDEYIDSEPDDFDFHGLLNIHEEGEPIDD
jgi:hypothetical protein